MSWFRFTVLWLPCRGCPSQIYMETSCRRNINFCLISTLNRQKLYLSLSSLSKRRFIIWSGSTYFSFDRTSELLIVGEAVSWNNMIFIKAVDEIHGGTNIIYFKQSQNEVHLTMKTCYSRKHWASQNCDKVIKGISFEWTYLGKRTRLRKEANSPTSGGELAYVGELTSRRRRVGVGELA